jgi:quercetin dioxygenase-like cupin family protein
VQRANRGALTVWESGAQPGEGPPLHVHVREDEFMYVLDGRLRFRLADDMSEAPAGSFVFIPKGLPHARQSSAQGSRRTHLVAAA